MTRAQLLKLDDELDAYTKQVDDLADRFNGSGNLVDDVHQFAREYSNNVNLNVDVLLTAMKLSGVLMALRFNVKEEIKRAG